MHRLSYLLVALTLSLPSTARAQLEPIPEEGGASGLALALRTLAGGATFMHTTAHPDDEDNGLLVLMSRGRGLRTVLLTTTRGDGGQNEIGPELFEAIGVLRTEELMTMHRFDGAEQYFTQAYEFGYSFSVEETLQKWGKEETLGDIVRIIRTVRPDVIVSLPLSGEGGGQHHQTSARLTQEAFRAASDATRFPEHFELGLRPWQPLKLYRRIWFQRSEDPDPPGTVAIDTGVYDPILGRSYYQMGRQGRAAHRCQGMSQLHGLPGEQISKWVLVDASIRTTEGEDDLFDGVQMGLDRLKDFLKGEGTAAGSVVAGIDNLQAKVAAAQAAFNARAPWKTIAPLREGLVALRTLVNDIASSSISDGARYELRHRLGSKETQFVRALALAHALSIDPVADRGEVTPGSRFQVDVHVTNRGPEPVEISTVELMLPPAWEQSTKEPTAGSLSENQTLKAGFEVTVAPDARLSRPYWRRNPDRDRYHLIEPEYFGLPAAPPAVRARVAFRSGQLEAVLEETVQYRYEGPWVGTEKQKEVSVLPALSVTVTPRVVVFPIRALDKTRTVTVEALYNGSGEASGTLRLETPPGFQVSPAEAPLGFRREKEAVSVRFTITPPRSIEPGSFPIRAVARLDGREYQEGYQTIAYHHIQTRYLFHPAAADIRALDVEVVPVTVGYVMGVGDDVPEAIRQLGAELVFLDEKELAQGDLSRYDVIVTGVRAYLNRPDLRAYNHRLLDYVHQGGTLLVQYNKVEEFNDAQWGPYPVQIGRDRITVEEAPMRILEPEHPVFNFPNPITARDWRGWVQERGLYFLGERDDRYRDLLASEDPWEYNAGEKRGMLVEARYGNGRWIYIGLGLFRQLPAGVPDAYKLFANLLSLTKAPVRTAAP